MLALIALTGAISGTISRLTSAVDTESFMTQIVLTFRLFGALSFLHQCLKALLSFLWDFHSNDHFNQLLKMVCYYAKKDFLLF